MTVALIILAVLVMLLASTAGVLLTVLTLPGVWLTLIIAIVCQLAYGEPRLFSWYTLGIATAVALLGEVYEFISSAAGAKKSGGGKSGALGSILGSLAGAIAGSMVVPIIGTILGAVIGAGVGALAFERGLGDKSWKQATRIGRGAAVGRFAGTVVKTVVAVVVGVVLTFAAGIP